MKIFSNHSHNQIKDHNASIFMWLKPYEGVARGGGFLVNPNGIILDRYAWGLCKKTNNQTEAYGLFYSLTLAQQKGIKDMKVLGDLS